jgi:hypothetical protein
MTTIRTSAPQPMRALRRVFIAAGLALLIAGCSTASATPTPAPTPTPTPTPTATDTPTPTLTDTPTPTLTDTPTPTPTAAPIVRRLCTGPEEVAAITIWHVVSGGTEIDFFTGSHTSTSGGTLCYLRGTSEGQIVSAGSIIADSGAASARILTSDPFVTQVPGDKVYSSILWSNWCTSPPADPISMSFVLPSGLGRVVVAGSGIPVPPCTSKSSPSTVTATSAWHH